MKWLLLVACILAVLLASGCTVQTGMVVAEPPCPAEGPCCGNDVCELGEGPGSCPDDCVCIPGERECYGNRVLECAHTGRYWNVVENCGNGCRNGHCAAGVYYDAQGFVMEYPEGWERIENYSMMGVNYAVGFFGPEEEAFEPSILVKTERGAVGYGLRDYAELSEAALAGDFSGNDYRLIDGGGMAIGDLDARFIRYSLNYNGIPVMGEQVFIRDEAGVFYIIIYTALEGTFDGELFHKAVQSFGFGEESSVLTI